MAHAGKLWHRVENFLSLLRSCCHLALSSLNLPLGWCSASTWSLYIGLGILPTINMPAKSPIKSEILYYPTEKDPLAFDPPEDETAVQREARVMADKAAQTISDAIDAELDKQRIAEKKSPKAVKVLLLGAFRYCPGDSTANAFCFLPKAKVNQVSIPRDVLTNNE